MAATWSGNVSFALSGMCYRVRASLWYVYDNPEVAPLPHNIKMTSTLSQLWGGEFRLDDTVAHASVPAKDFIIGPGLAFRLLSVDANFAALLSDMTAQSSSIILRLPTGGAFLLHANVVDSCMDAIFTTNVSPYAHTDRYKPTSTPITTSTIPRPEQARMMLVLANQAPLMLELKNEQGYNIRNMYHGAQLTLQVRSNAGLDERREVRDRPLDAAVAATAGGEARLAALVQSLAANNQILSTFSKDKHLWFIFYPAAGALHAMVVKDDREEDVSPMETEPKPRVKSKPAVSSPTLHASASSKPAPSVVKSVKSEKKAPAPAPHYDSAEEGAEEEPEAIVEVGENYSFSRPPTERQMAAALKAKAAAAAAPASEAPRPKFSYAKEAAKAQTYEKAKAPKPKVDTRSESSASEYSGEDRPKAKPKAAPAKSGDNVGVEKVTYFDDDEEAVKKHIVKLCDALEGEAMLHTSENERAAVDYLQETLVAAGLSKVQAGGTYSKVRNFAGGAQRQLAVLLPTLLVFRNAFRKAMVLMREQNSELRANGAKLSRKKIDFAEVHRAKQMDHQRSTRPAASESSKDEIADLFLKMDAKALAHEGGDKDKAAIYTHELMAKTKGTDTYAAGTFNGLRRQLAGMEMDHAYQQATFDKYIVQLKRALEYDSANEVEEEPVPEPVREVVNKPTGAYVSKGTHYAEYQPLTVPNLAPEYTHFKEDTVPWELKEEVFGLMQQLEARTKAKMGEDADVEIARAFTYGKLNKIGYTKASQTYIKVRNYVTGVRLRPAISEYKLNEVRDALRLAVADENDDEIVEAAKEGIVFMDATATTTAAAPAAEDAGDREPVKKQFRDSKKLARQRSIAARAERKAANPDAPPELKAEMLRLMELMHARAVAHGHTEQPQADDYIFEIMFKTKGDQPFSAVHYRRIRKWCAGEDVGNSYSTPTIEKYRQQVKKALDYNSETGEFTSTKTKTRNEDSGAGVFGLGFGGFGGFANSPPRSRALEPPHAGVHGAADANGDRPFLASHPTMPEIIGQKRKADPADDLSPQPKRSPDEERHGGAGEGGVSLSTDMEA